MDTSSCSTTLSLPTEGKELQESEQATLSLPTEGKELQESEQVFFLPSTTEC